MATDKKNIWKIVIQTLITILTSIGTAIQTLITILTSIGTALGVISCA